MTLIMIASIACAYVNYGTMCFSDLDAPIIYAYDAVGQQGVVITREPWTVTFYQ